LNIAARFAAASVRSNGYASPVARCIGFAGIEVQNLALRLEQRVLKLATH
jgi:hypothetical protein